MFVCDNKQMLLFCELLQQEYNEKENKPDKQINIDNVLNKYLHLK